MAVVKLRRNFYIDLLIMVKIRRGKLGNTVLYVKVFMSYVEMF